jgi:cytochrome c oxidase cbb3-type subunit 2
MKGLAPLFLGIFGTFAFSWVGLTVIPNWQIGDLNPQSDEEGTDVYPQPQSGMFERGAHVYAANGCVYCHSQQVRPDYAGADIERKWGIRRSAPRDYIFERPAFLGKMRLGQDIANIGARAPAEAEAAASPGAGASPAASPAQQGGAPAPAGGASPGANPSQSPAAAAPKAQGAPAAASPAPAGSPSSASSPAVAIAASSAASPGSSPPTGAAPPSPKTGLASPSAGAVANTMPATSPSPAAGAPWPIQTIGEPPMYSAAWHHVHLYSPRSINPDSNMPAYRFLYQKRRISDARSADALKLTGSDAPPEGWEIVPSFEARCLVAYMMALNQSHPLNEVRSVGSAPAAPAAAGSPPPSLPAAK